MNVLDPRAVVSELKRQSRSDEVALRESFRKLSPSIRDLLASCLPRSNERMLVRKVIREKSGRGPAESGNFDAMQSWMFGCLVFELFHGRPIVESDDVAVVRRKLEAVAEKRLPFIIDPTRREATEYTFAGRSMVPNIDALLTGLLHPDPERRMSIDQALDHEAFKMLTIDARTHRQLAKFMTELEMDSQPASIVSELEERPADSSSDTSGYESVKEEPRSRMGKIGRSIRSNVRLGLEAIGKARTSAAR